MGDKMADNVRQKQGILEWIAKRLFPQPIKGAAERSTEQRQRVEGQRPSKMEEVAGIEEPPKSEGKSNYEGIPRQKFYK